MSTENFDHGANKANGRVVVGANAAASTVTGKGMGPAEHQGTGVMRISILEAIAEDEFLCVTGREGDDGTVAATWVDVNHFDLEISDQAGAAAAGTAWFIVYRGSDAEVVITDA